MSPTTEEIWKEFGSRLSQFIRARVADSSTAEDILHDVFTKVQRHLDEFHDPAKLQGWLFLVARNTIIDHYRTQRKTTELPESLSDDDGFGNEIEVKELEVVFRRLLESMPAPYREALKLTEFEGLTQEQLARRLGISVSGAKSRVQRGREMLKELLLDFCHREFSRAVGSQPCPKGLLPVVSKENSATKSRTSQRKAKSKDRP
jgi:RNA polymerase sigma-70 factor (ECF subfamily)